MSGLTLFAAGLALLVGGAELVLRGASRLATALGVRPMVLGLTVVSIGTSVPEMAIGITASAQGSGGLAVGNIAGTNVFNILFILGLSALLQPLALHMRVIRLDLPVMIIAALMMTAMAWDGVLTRLDGGVMFVVAVLYTMLLIRVSRGETRAVKAAYREMYGGERRTRPTPARRYVLYVAMLAAGIAVTVLGADWLVDGAVEMARAFAISDAMIGLTIVAVGTSAPELVTTIVATIKDERDVAVGNLLGSSIYNILVILGVTCLVSPEGLPVERQLLLVDIPLMTSVALLCVPVFATDKRVSRAEGGGFLAIYAAYMLFIILSRT